LKKHLKLGTVKKLLFGHPERNTPLRSSKHICEDTIQVGLKEMGWVHVGLIQNFPVPFTRKIKLCIIGLIIIAFE
jgi:hypothetical protein